MPARCEVEDFISCGLEALIHSIDRYDPAKGATLEQYAWTRIHGAVLDELRRQDWAPRSVRRWERDIERAAESFTALHGRRPTTEELAEALGVHGRRAAPPPRRDRAVRPHLAEHARARRRRDHDRAHRHHRRQRPAATTRCTRRPRSEAKDQLPRRLRPPPAPRARGRRPALRQEPDAGRDRRDPRRLREPRLPDPRR